MSLYTQALKKYGLQAQLDMLQEEASEVIKAISKLRRKRRYAIVNLAEEIADIEILVAQVKVGLNLSKKVNIWKVRKLKRLALRLRKP